MKQLNQYTVNDAPIGSGGMGQVYSGVSPDGVPVAIKEIMPEFTLDMEFQARLRREISILQKLNNPSIVKVYDSFNRGDSLYIVMELVEGQNIEQYINSHGPFSPKEASELMVKILRSIQYVHENNIIHRDIKPSNIMVRPNKEVCILDFGIAKDTTQQGMTLMFSTLGTSGYMSPEQAEGLNVDHRTDVYALGCLFFYMLTGQHAINLVGSDFEKQKAIAQTPMPRLNQYLKEDCSNLQMVLDRATDKNMVKRYQSCREFAMDIMRVSGLGTIAASVPSVSVSIGRENCEICIGLDNYKVSRHHADVRYEQFDDEGYYIYTDCSSNGTTINGRPYTKGMTCKIPLNDNPVILLAGDKNSSVDWNQVTQLIKSKLEAASGNGDTLPRPKGNVEPMPAPPHNNPMPIHGQNFGGHPMGNQGPNYGPNPIGSGVPGAMPNPPMAPQMPYYQGSTRSIGFLEAVSICFNKYATFSGRASRSEFWFFTLFNFLVNIFLSLITWAIVMMGSSTGSMIFIGFVLIGLYSLATILPSLAVTVRRLHDTARSGVWLLLAFVPFGGLVLFIFYCLKGTPGPNPYGPDPLS